MKKRFYIETFGCQMNKGDSDLMALSLETAGFERADGETDADILIFNTCSVRDHAELRALARVRSVRKSDGALVVIAGCMAQRLGDSLVADGTADLVVGPYQSPKIGTSSPGASGGGQSARFCRRSRKTS